MSVAGRIEQRLLRSEAARNYLLISPTMTVLVFALAAPLALMIMYSFWRESGLVLDTNPTLAQYAVATTRAIYRVLFLRSLAIASLVTLTTVVLGYPMAYFLAFRVKRGKFIWLLLLSIPFWTSYLLRVFAWKIILGYEGLINSGLLRLGLVSQPLDFLLYNATSVVIALTHSYAAFTILPIYVSLEKIDPALLEAAADLGDSAFQRFLRIVLPLSLPGVIAAAVLTFVPVLGDYVTPTLVGGSDGLMIANMIQVQFGRANNWPLGAALAVSSMALVAVLIILFVQAAQLAAAKIR